MKFPKPDNEFILKRLQLPEGKIHMVLDTDTYNEVDDQFALCYAMTSPERLVVEGVYAAPFFNDRSTGPADGMQKSYDEIIRLLGKMNVSTEGFVFKGSDRYLPDDDTPVESEAARDLIKKAMSRGGDEPLYVVALGAITNVASAILMEPEIIKKIVVVWLGGHPVYWNDTREFNLFQDVAAARVIFDSGVPVVQIPCMGVASHLLTNIPELEASLSGKNELCDALVEIVKGYNKDHFGWAKEIWDISTIGYLNHPECVPTALVHSPLLSDEGNWSMDTNRHFIKSATFVRRNGIFKDMFTKLSSLK